MPGKWKYWLVQNRSGVARLIKARSKEEATSMAERRMGWRKADAWPANEVPEIREMAKEIADVEQAVPGHGQPADLRPDEAPQGLLVGPDQDGDRCRTQKARKQR